MNRLVIGLFLSLAFHTLLLLRFKMPSESTNLPLGRTIIGQVKLVSIVPPIKRHENSQKKQKREHRTNKNILNRNKILKEKIASHTSTKIQAIYLTYLRTLIEKNKEYPFVARKLKLEGTNEVLLNISQDGTYRYKLIIMASNEILNKATKRLFNKIHIFKPLPKDLNSLELTVPIQYKLE